MLLCVWKLFWQPTPTVTSMHTYYVSIRSSCIYEDVNYPFEDDLYILNCVELRKGPCVKLFTKVHQFDLVLTDTENMMSHYKGSSKNT